VTVPTPDISKLYIQVNSTKSVDVTTPEGLAHKCAIASDLSEVDRMMKDVGFDGYPNPDSMALFDHAFVREIPQGDKKIVRDVVRAILDPAGVAEPLIQALKSNNDLYDEKVLNVYYVDPDPAALSGPGFDYISILTGVHLRDKDGNSEKIIFISDSARSDTVAHEFAHAFSSGHINFWEADGDEWCIKFLPHPGTDMPSVNMECEFTHANYMWAASAEDRQDLIDAQKERMMRNEHSVIFNYSPPQDKLNCPDFSADPHDETPEDDACPRMGL
jgi:hypothetical protein